MIAETTSLKDNKEFKRLYRETFFTIQTRSFMSRFGFTADIGKFLSNELITADIYKFKLSHSTDKNIEVSSKKYSNIFRIENYFLSYNPLRETVLIFEYLHSFSSCNDEAQSVGKIVYEADLLDFIKAKNIDSQNIEEIKRQRDFGTMNLTNIQRQSEGVFIILSTEEQEELKKLIENPILKKVKEFLRGELSKTDPASLSEEKLLMISKEIIRIGTETGFSKNKFTYFKTGLLGFEALKQEIQNNGFSVTDKDLGELAIEIDYILKNQMTIEILDAIGTREPTKEQLKSMTVIEKIEILKEQAMNKEDLRKYRIEKIKSLIANHKTKKKNYRKDHILNIKTEAQRKFKEEREQELKKMTEWSLLPRIKLCEIY